MQNIEIKARANNPREIERIASNLAGGRSPFHARQIDTYFNVPQGRLKLREFAGGGTDSELLFYLRPDQVGPGLSTYQTVEISDPALLKDILASALGVKLVVRKRRTVYFFQNVRIHLDEVEGLGAFLELEAALSDESQEESCKATIRALMKKFRIAAGDLVKKSYCDLILNNQGQANLS